MATVEETPSPMFCFQCEQTAKGIACTVHGRCQKNPDIAALQDNLVHMLHSIAVYANRDLKKIPREVDMFVAKALFLTLTNVNFSVADHVAIIKESKAVRTQVAELVGPQVGLPDIARFEPGENVEEMLRAGRELCRIDANFGLMGKDRACLRELSVYGMKGAATYLYHAMELGAGPSSDVTGFFYRTMAAFYDNPDAPAGDLLGKCLDIGAANLRAMEMLDAAHTEHFKDPSPAEVMWIKNARHGSDHPGKAILVSGHDLLALHRLQQEIIRRGLQGRVFVYTHGEMLPAHGYPGLRQLGAESALLAGHYGTAWQNQVTEFAEFPGPILMTTNCYIPAPPTYVGRVYVMGPVGGDNTKRVDNWNYTELIEAALEMPGFAARERDAPSFKTTVGFGHAALTGAIPTLLEAVRKGELKRIVLIGGCDGFEKERNYFTDLAAALPKETLILTLACGRFKVNQMDYGKLGSTGIPRLLDVGQCNDSYSAIVAATALAKELGSDVNSIPLSFVVSWFEQKAVAILLTLLYLGIKNIYLGPRLPGFFTPTILKTLVDKYQIRGVGTVEQDMAQIMTGE